MPGGITTLETEKKNLIKDKDKVHQFTWGELGVILHDNQIKFRVRREPKKDKETYVEMKGKVIFIDGSSRGEKIKSAIICKTNGKTVKQEVRKHATGTAQSAEVAALLMALQYCKEKNWVKPIIIADSEYVLKAINETLDVWTVNGFITAKGKGIAYKEDWIKIRELKTEVKPIVVHQSSHTTQKTYAADGNREVDMLMAVKAITSRQESYKLLKDLHDQHMHPSTKWISTFLTKNKINVANHVKIYEKVKMKCPNCRKTMTARHNEYGHIKTEEEGQQISMDFAGPIRQRRNIFTS